MSSEEQMETQESEIPVPESAEEPPSKKSKIAEEALKKIEEEKKRKEQEKLDAEERAKKAKQAELEKFWKVVKDDPTDFTGNKDISKGRVLCTDLTDETRII